MATYCKHVRLSLGIKPFTYLRLFLPYVYAAAAQCGKEHKRSKPAIGTPAGPARYEHFCTHFIHFANAFVTVFWSQWTASSSASWRASSPPANFVCRQSSMMCVIVCRCPHWHESDWAMPQRWRLAWQVPWPVRNRFRRVHGWRSRSKPGGRTAGSGTRPWLTTEADTQASLHRSSVTPVVSLLYWDWRTFSEELMKKDGVQLSHFRGWHHKGYQATIIWISHQTLPMGLCAS